MRIGKALAAAATLGLLAAPLQAASLESDRQSAAVEGENLAGGGISDTVLIAGLIVALGALVYIAADDESVDLPASP
jgi:hypothetical protein